MVYRRIANVMWKEWEATLYNFNSALFVTLLPLIITAQALVLIYLIVNFAGGEMLMDTMLRAGVERAEEMMPALADLPTTEKFQALFYLQIPVYLLLIPIMIAVSFATFSIVEEKQTGTLEPLLATPVRTWELLLGKALAGTVPAVIITWICAGLFLLGAWRIGPTYLVWLVLDLPWFISLFLLVPLVTVISFMLGVIASSRARDAKNAQNIVIIIVLPLMLIIAAQLIGVTLFTSTRLLVMAGVFVFVVVIVLRAAVSMFQRESIIVKWK